jgi:hypothetical protein
MNILSLRLTVAVNYDFVSATKPDQLALLASAGGAK